MSGCLHGKILTFVLNTVFFLVCVCLCWVLVAAHRIFSWACELSVAACGIEFPDHGWNLHWSEES